MADISQFDTAKRGHHPDSPSSLQASEACPLFENEQRESLASIAGTLQHKAAETRDLTILESEEQVAAVNRCIEKEENCIAILTADNAPAKVIREVYLPVGDDIVHGELDRWIGVTGGYPDTLVLSADERWGIILDFKFGKVAVTPTKDNLQGIAYALGAFLKYPTLESVAVIFFAPYQEWSAEEQETKYEHTFHRINLPEMELKIRTVVARKRAAYKARHEQNDWSAACPRQDLCVYCGAKGECHKNLALVFKATGGKYAPAEVPENIATIDLSTPEQIARAYDAVNHLEPILKAIKKRCIELCMERDDMLPEGWRVNRRQDREIVSLEALIEAAKRHGVKKKELEGLFTLPISKIEELIKSKAEKGMGAAAVRGFGETLETMNAVQLGKPSIFLSRIKTPAEKPKTELLPEAPINI